MKLKKWKLIASILAIILLGTCRIVIAIWLQGTMSPTEIALKALDSDDQVLVSREANFIVFELKNQNPSIGLIFYPGARVDFQSYVPILHKIPEHGYFSALLSMPLNIAFLNPNLSDQVIENYPEIDKWVIGGHSLGGVVLLNQMGLLLFELNWWALFILMPAAGFLSGAYNRFRANETLFSMDVAFPTLIGLFLVGLSISLLVGAAWNINWSLLWPLIIIFIGLGMIFGRSHKE